MTPERRAQLARIADQLSSIPSGGAKWFDLPGQQPYSRNLYLTIHRQAYRLWKGAHSMHSEPGGVTVERRRAERA